MELSFEIYSALLGIACSHIAYVLLYVPMPGPSHLPGCTVGKARAPPWHVSAALSLQTTGHWQQRVLLHPAPSSSWSSQPHQGVWKLVTRNSVCRENLPYEDPFISTFCVFQVYCMVLRTRASKFLQILFSWEVSHMEHLHPRKKSPHLLITYGVMGRACCSAVSSLHWDQLSTWSRRGKWWLSI